MTTHAQHTNSHHHKQDNGLAIASLILGILSLTGLGALTGIPAIVTGYLSLKNPTDKGLGVAGLVMGIVSTVLTILVVLFFIFLIILAAIGASSSNDEYYEQTPADTHTSETRSI